MSYVYKHPRDMEPIEREKFFIKSNSNWILEYEKYKKNKDDLLMCLVGGSFWEEEIAACKKRISEARVKLAALQQAQRDSYSVSKSIDKKLGTTDE